MLMHIDQPRRHRAALTIDLNGRGGIDPANPFDLVAFHQHIDLFHRVAGAVPDVYVCNQYLERWFFFLLLCLGLRQGKCH